MRARFAAAAVDETPQPRRSAVHSIRRRYIFRDESAVEREYSWPIGPLRFVHAYGDRKNKQPKLFAEYADGEKRERAVGRAMAYLQSGSQARIHVTP